MPKKTTRGSVEELKEALEVSRIQARQLLTTAVDRKKTIGALERELGSKHQELKELENRLSMLEQRALRREASLPLLRKRERTIEKLEAKLRATQEWLAQSRARSQKLLDDLRSKTERVEELEVLIHQSEGSVNRDKTTALLRREQKKLRQYKAVARRLERDLESLKSSHEKAVTRLSERDARIDELERLVIGRTPEALESRLKLLEKQLETATRERAQQTQIEQLLEQELARILQGEVPRLEELEIPEAKKASLASLADFVLEREQTVDELRFRVLEANDQMQRYRTRMDQLKSRLLISQRKAEKLRRELVETARLEHAENLILAEREERIGQLENDLRQAQQDLQDQQTVTAGLRTLISQHGTMLTDEPAKMVEHLRGLLENREKLVEELQQVADTRAEKVKALNRLAESRLREAERLQTEIATRDGRLGELSEVTSKQEETIATLDCVAKNRARRITNLEEALWERESELDRLSSLVCGQQETIGTLEQSVAQRDARLEELEQLQEQREERLKALRKMVEVWEGKGHSLERLLSNRVARIKELEELVSDRANRVRELEQELDHKSRDISRLETDVEAGGVKDLALIELETEAAAMRSRLRDLDALASSQVAENSTLRDQLRERAEEVLRLRESLEHRDADLEELRETVLELDSSAADKGDALEKLQRELTKLQQENSIARQQLSGETSSRRELERTLYQKEEALAEALDLAHRRAEQIAGLEQHLQEAVSTGSADRGKIIQLESALDDSRTRDQELASLRQELQRLKLACERSTQAAEEKAREVEATRSALNLLEQQIHDRDELVGDLEQLLELREEHLSSMESSLSETSQRQQANQAQLKELETALARERDRVRELMAFQQGDDQRVATLSHQLTVKDSRIRSLEAALAEKNSRRAQQEEDADSITAVRTRLLETRLRNEELEKGLQQLQTDLQALQRQGAEQASVIGTLEQKLVLASGERNQAWAQLDQIKNRLEITSREFERLRLEYDSKSRAWDRERQEREELLVRGERMEKAQGEEICRLKERLLRTMAEKADLETRMQAC